MNDTDFNVESASFTTNPNFNPTPNDNQSQSQSQSEAATNYALVAAFGQGQEVNRLDLAIAAWLASKSKRSGSKKTATAYRDGLAGFRATLHQQGLDLDQSPPVVALLAQAWAAWRSTPTSASHANANANATNTNNSGTTSTSTNEHAGTTGNAISLDSRPAAAAATKEVAAATFNQRLAILSSFYGYAKKSGLLPLIENPIERVERRPAQAYAGAKALDYQEVKKCLAMIDRTTLAGQRDFALIALGLQTGRRLTELATLRRGDLYLAGGLVATRNINSTSNSSTAGTDTSTGVSAVGSSSGSSNNGSSGNSSSSHVRDKDASKITVLFRRTKGGKTTSDLLPVPTSRAIMEWLAAFYGIGALATLDNAAPVFVSLSRQNRGASLSIQAIADICLLRLGTSQVHSLRHTFAKAMEDSGAKVSDIQARLQHASLATTGRYLAALKQAENPQADKLATLFGI